MLDKSVPYAEIYMRRQTGTPLARFPLPEGFLFSFYKDGDEVFWAKIETSVLEFGSEFAALLYFKEKFLPYNNELYTRCLFIESADGEKVATATAWWNEKGGVRYPWLYWVAVKPEYQCRGLGKALVSRITELMTGLEGDTDFYLHTQTWSYKAVDIYKRLGFEITGEKLFYKSICGMQKAVRILKRIEKKRRRPPG